MLVQCCCCAFAVKVVENKHAYFAERLYHSMKVELLEL